MEAEMISKRTKTYESEREEYLTQLTRNSKAIAELESQFGVIKAILQETKTTVDELKRKINNGFAEEVARALLGIKRTWAEKRAVIMLEIIKIVGTVLGSGGLVYLLFKR
jgi:chromosome segregation ATPase